MRASRWSGFWVIAAATLLVIALGAARAEAAQRHKWWGSEEIKAELDLTNGQSEAIEEIFQTTQPNLRKLKNRLDEETAVLSAMVATMEVMERELTLQIDKVESARGALSKSRILMLYRMHRELSAEQRDALHEWLDQLPRRRRRAPSG
jgi:Spy/CpxP family protein refolding chaperone